ncbi:MAG: ABC transporter permease, partial [Deltaproteobacteria bacterium]|nr:ABC transporter permease [Deltaproteobacteria bacterium]
MSVEKGRGPDQEITSKKVARRKYPFVAFFLLGLFLVTAFFGPLFAPHDPDAQDLSYSLKPPFWVEGGSMSHLLGTDSLGRDYLSRIIYGARISLLVSSVAICICGTIGVLLGLLSGYFGGLVDTLIMRFTDTWISMPALILAIAFVSILGPGLRNVILVIGITAWTGYARIVRGEVLGLKELDFVDLARATGCSEARILFSHILPNVVNTLIILVTLDIGRVIIWEAALSFLGLGVQHPTPAWGLMLAGGRKFITSAWWLVTFPGIAILITVLGANLTGNWLRDVLDPKQK